MSDWKSLCYTSPLSVETVRNFSEHSQQIDWTCIVRDGNVPCARCSSGELSSWGGASPPQSSSFHILFLTVHPCHVLQFCCLFMFQQIWWLDPELTYGNAKPFVFTQGHSVCNRSFFPCFDTPAVKCTYSATVKVRDAWEWFMELLVAVNLWKHGYIRCF